MHGGQSEADGRAVNGRTGRFNGKREPIVTFDTSRYQGRRATDVHRAGRVPTVCERSNGVDVYTGRPGGGFLYCPMNPLLTHPGWHRPLVVKLRVGVQHSGAYPSFLASAGGSLYRT